MPARGGCARRAREAVFSFDRACPGHPDVAVSRTRAHKTPSRYKSSCSWPFRVRHGLALPFPRSCSRTPLRRPRRFTGPPPRSRCLGLWLRTPRNPPPRVLGLPLARRHRRRRTSQRPASEVPAWLRQRAASTGQHRREQRRREPQEFGAVEVEGRLRSPQLIYFLRRVRANFRGDPGHRSLRAVRDGPTSLVPMSATQHGHRPSHRRRLGHDGARRPRSARRSIARARESRRARLKPGIAAEQSCARSARAGETTRQARSTASSTAAAWKIRRIFAVRRACADRRRRPRLPQYGSRPSSFSSSLRPRSLYEMARRLGVRPRSSLPSCVSAGGADRALTTPRPSTSR